MIMFKWAPLPRPVQLIFLLPGSCHPGINSLRQDRCLYQTARPQQYVLRVICAWGYALGVDKYLIILTVFKVVTTGFCLLDVSADLIQRAAAA